METYQQTYTILASDMDVTYHITPNAIMLYFQDCFARFLSSKHLAAFDIIKENLIWVISDFELHFLKERPLWSSTIKVNIRFTEISTIRIYVDYWLTDEADETFVEGTSIWAILNNVTKRPFAAKEYLSQGGIVADGDVTTTRCTTDSSEKAFLKEVTHQVNVTDLDFNGHVCNRTYLSIAVSTFPLEFVKTYSPHYIHIKFTRESFINEKLTCRIFSSPHQQYWFDILNAQGKEVCAIYTEWDDSVEVLSKDVSEQINR